MVKHLIGYQQGDGSYVYVESINSYNIGVTLDINNCLEFKDETMAKNVCEFLNYKDNNKQVYLALIVTVDVKEADKDVTTSK